MLNRSFALGLYVAAAATAATVSVAGADELLTFDLSVPNQVTVTATAGLSGATVSGSNNVGVYMDGFFTLPGGVFSIADAGAATFTSVGAPASTSPLLYRADTFEMGLNIFNWSTTTNVGFTAGTQAFTGTAVFTLTPMQYAAFLAGNTGGNVYFPADSADDLATAPLMGTWRVVPTPGAAVLAGVGGLAAAGARRRRG